MDIQNVRVVFIVITPFFLFVSLTHLKGNSHKKAQIHKMLLRDIIESHLKRDLFGHLWLF